MSMKLYDIAIVGGGAAGLMAATRCASKGLKVIVLEKNRECGKKILITGKGRCNITNISPWREFQTHIHPDKSFIKNAFYHFSNEDVVSFLEGIGLPCKTERGNRVFPVSDRSHDVRDTLVSYLKNSGIEVACGCEVERVSSSGDNFSIEMAMGQDRGVTIRARRVILATGGLSYPTTGSTGDGYDISQSLGHTIINTFPSLTALKPVEPDSRLEGLLLKNVRLDLWVNGSVVQSEFGEMQFTSGGIEGALGFRVSRKGVKGLINGQKVEVSIDLKPAVEEGELTKRVEELASGMKSPNVIKLLPKLMPSQMIDSFVESSSPGLSVNNLAKRLKDWRFKISGYVGYERAVVTAGGVSLDEVSRKTLESKLVSGLFFAGELLDIDGDTGGYNLQIAFSTGAMAADSAIKSLAI